MEMMGSTMDALLRHSNLQLTKSTLWERLEDNVLETHQPTIQTANSLSALDYSSDESSTVEIRAGRNHQALKVAIGEEPKLNDISVVHEFEDVFPEDLSGLPPQRQVELCTNSQFSWSVANCEVSIIV
ncbi:hypothetical protein Tco_0286137 [Tanacetum coccineum]